MSILGIIPEVILASKSKPRSELLAKFHIKFKILPSDIDESPNEGEQPNELVERLSREKGRIVLDQILLNKKNQLHNAKSTTENNYIVISSDQIAVVDNKIYGKPGNYENAVQQLKSFSDKELTFITGLFVLPYGEYFNLEHKKGIYINEISTLKIKKLSEEQIKNYLNKEQPYNCAASFKIEGLGITLVDSIQTEDFNAIIGLPLLKLSKIFTKLNLDVLSL